MATIMLNGDSSFAIKAEWNGLSGRVADFSPEQSVAEHTALIAKVIALMEVVANGSNLQKGEGRCTFVRTWTP